jgi:hypothetical protein
LQVLDVDQVDTFDYKLKLLSNPTVQLVTKLEGESNSKMISPLFELNQKSSFKNIYVYIGRTDEGTIEYVEALVNSDTNTFIIDMDVVNVEKDRLDLVHGPSDDRVNYTAVSTRGNLFP